jgi:hypothetical protein
MVALPAVLRGTQRTGFCVFLGKEWIFFNDFRFNDVIVTLVAIFLPAKDRPAYEINGL